MVETVRLTRRPRTAVLVLLTVIAVVGAVLLAGQRSTRAAERQAAETASPQPVPSVGGEPVLSKPVSLPEGSAPPAPGLSNPVPPLGRGFLTVRIPEGRKVALLAKPGGRRIATLGPTTEFGSPRVLSVVERRGTWLGVHVPELPNGKLGWIDGRASQLAFARTTLSVRVDLSQRRLVVRDRGRVVHEAVIAVGAATTPTPTGRFAVTDLLDGAPWGGTYGCCIVALSATQPQLPPGWEGGNRIAIHGTNRPEWIGQPVSSGCMRADDEDLRYLFKRLPLGTPVTIVA